MTRHNQKTERKLFGGSLEPLNGDECRACLHWITGQSETVPASCSDIQYALFHGDDGVAWGRRNKDGGGWQRGSDHFPEVSPEIREKTLQELRLFGGSGEIMIWRTEKGLRGRKLFDEKKDADLPDAGKPLDEFRILRGEHFRENRADFTHIATPGGAEQAVPVKLRQADEAILKEYKLRLQVRHYFEADENTGAVRVAATRLVDIKGDFL